MTANVNEDDLMGELGEEIMEYIYLNTENNEMFNDELKDALQRKKPRFNRMGYPIKTWPSNQDSESASPPTGNYFAGDGKRQVLYDSIYDKYVPSSGEPTTGGKHAKLVYALYKIQYEFFNNGFMNAFEDFSDGLTKEELKCDRFQWGYDKMLGFLYSVSPTAGSLITHFNIQKKELDEKFAAEDSTEGESDEEESEDKQE